MIARKVYEKKISELPLASRYSLCSLAFASFGEAAGGSMGGVACMTLHVSIIETWL